MDIKNIVLIEDDEFFATSFMKRINKFNDITIHHYTSFESGFEHLANLNPEILFLDHNLGGINGVDALPIIKKVVPKCEIVIISAQKELAVLQKALSNGASKYFSKDSLVVHNSAGFIQEIVDRETTNPSFWTRFFNSYMNPSSKSE